MTVGLEEIKPADKLEPSGEVVELSFAQIAVGLADVADEMRKVLLEDAHSKRVAELMSIREAILRDMLDRNPHEAMIEIIVDSLRELYKRRTVYQKLPDGTRVETFATRNSTNVQLEDIYSVATLPDDSMVVSMTSRDENGFGYSINVVGEHVTVATLVPGYEIVSRENEPSVEGMPNHYMDNLSQAYLHALATAGIVIKRNRADVANGTDESGKADTDSLTMLTRQMQARGIL